MKNRSPLFLLAAIAGTALAAPARASCDDGGYLYLWETCVQERVSGTPHNICEVREDTENLRTVVITSNVLYDAPGNGRYPTSVFFDEAGLQRNLTINARESVCYRRWDDAENDRREFLADQKRTWDDEVIFVTIQMPDT